MNEDGIRTLMRVTAILDALQLAYAVGGSVASSIFGEPRGTNDTDILLDLGEDLRRPLEAALAEDFFVFPSQIATAIARRGSFNIVDKVTCEKVDLFVAGPAILDREQLTRAQRRSLVKGGPLVSVTSPEMIILRKLDWYRRGGSVSSRQWRDVLGVLKVQGGRLQRTSMVELAHDAGLSGLLDEALEQAGMTET